MPSHAEKITDPTLQKLVDGLISSVRLPTGGFVAEAPNGFTDSQGKVTPITDTDEFEIVIRILPDGQSASASIRPIGSRAKALIGPIDNSMLATKLAT